MSYKTPENALKSNQIYSEGDNPGGNKEWKMKLLLKQVHPCNAFVYDTCVF